MKAFDASESLNPSSNFCSTCCARGSSLATYFLLKSISSLHVVLAHSADLAISTTSGWHASRAVDLELVLQKLTSCSINVCHAVLSFVRPMNSKRNRECGRMNFLS